MIPQFNEMMGSANPKQRQSLMQLIQRLRNPQAEKWPQVPQGFRGNIPALKGPQGRANAATKF